MATEAERRKEWDTFRKIDAAFRNGDLAALRVAVDDPACVPNGPMPLANGPCLEYAIYHSPISLIRALLAALIQCAPTARIASGGRFHPESCRLIWKLTSGLDEQSDGLKPRDKGRFGRPSDPAGRNASEA